MKLKKPVKKIGGIFVEILMVIPCVCICIISRYVKKDIDVGLGPMPLINNVYHKTALIEAGFSAETFVNNTWFIRLMVHNLVKRGLSQVYGELS